MALRYYSRSRRDNYLEFKYLFTGINYMSLDKEVSPSLDIRGEWGEEIEEPEEPGTEEEGGTAKEDDADDDDPEDELE